MNKEQAQIKLDNLVKNVHDWAEARGIYDPENGSKQYDQAVKLIEELGEFANGFKKNKTEEIKDALGDMLVVLINVFYLGVFGNTKLQITPYIERTLESLSKLNNEDREFDKNVRFVRLTGNFQEILRDSFNNDPNGAHLHSIWESLENLLILEHLFGFEPLETLSSAYDVIKDRKGKMINRVFVKEADLA